MPKPVIVLGAGGHGRVIADVVRSAGREVLGFLDDSLMTEGVAPVLGKLEDAPRFMDQAEFIIGIGSNQARKQIAERYEGRLAFTSVVHQSAVVAPGVIIGEGSVVMAGAVINVGSVLGRHCVVNTAASVDHDCALHDYVHVSPGAHLAGTVTLGEGTWVGLGGLVINGVSLCPWCVIGAGGVVIKDLTKAGTYVGVPVRQKAVSE